MESRKERSDKESLDTEQTLLEEEMRKLKEAKAPLRKKVGELEALQQAGQMETKQGFQLQDLKAHVQSAREKFRGLLEELEEVKAARGLMVLEEITGQQVSAQEITQSIEDSGTHAGIFERGGSIDIVAANEKKIATLSGAKTPAEIVDLLSSENLIISDPTKLKSRSDSEIDAVRTFYVRGLERVTAIAITKQEERKKAA